MRIAYLTSQYPAVSHAFIRREVAGLRHLGVDVRTFSVRPPSDADVLCEADRREAQTTLSLLPTTARALLAAHGRALVRWPRRYFATLCRALARRAAGMRALLWAVFYFAEAILLAEALRRCAATHLHSHFANPGSDVGLLAAEYLGVPWSVTLHGTCDFEYPAAVTLGAKLAAARFVVCASNFGRAQAMRVLPPRRWNDVHVVHCGVELDQFSGIRSLRGTGRGRRRRLLCVARLSEEKGLPGLLEAFASLVAGGHDLELHLVGEGHLRGDLEERIQAQGFGERCVLTGPLTDAPLLEEFRSADVFVLASLMEGLSVVLMEAMAAGVPVVAPRVGGIPELVQDGQTGVLFGPGDWDGLAEAVQRLLSDPVLRERVVQGGRARVEREHDSARNAASLLRLFRDSAEEGHPR